MRIVHGPGIPVEWSDKELAKLREVQTRERSSLWRQHGEQLIGPSMKKWVDACHGKTDRQVELIISRRINGKPL